MALEQTNQFGEADAAYQKVMDLDPVVDIGQLAQKGRSRIAEMSFRNEGKYRADAMEYCLAAIKRFEGMPRSEVQKITFEIAMLGSKGLNVKDPVEQYTLRSIPGSFSGLHLVCIQYVGFKIIEPSLDLGFDLSREYQMALSMHRP